MAVAAEEIPGPGVDVDSFADALSHVLTPLHINALIGVKLFAGRIFVKG